jgi:hypothetical protein
MLNKHKYSEIKLVWCLHHQDEHIITNYLFSKLLCRSHGKSKTLVPGAIMYPTHIEFDVFPNAYCNWHSQKSYILVVLCSLE